MSSSVIKSDLKAMYNNIGYICDLSTNSFKEKAKKTGKIAIGIFFLIGAFFAHPFNHSNKISDKFAKRYLPTLEPKETGDDLIEAPVPERQEVKPTAPLAPPQRYLDNDLLFEVIKDGLPPEASTTLLEESQPYIPKPPEIEPTLGPEHSDDPPPSYEPRIDPEIIRQHLIKFARERYQKVDPPGLTMSPPTSLRDPKVWDSARLEMMRNQDFIPIFYPNDPLPSDGKIFISPESAARQRKPLSPEEKEKQRFERETRYAERYPNCAFERMKYRQRKASRSTQGQRLQTPRKPVNPPLIKTTRRDVAIDIRLSPQEQLEFPSGRRKEFVDV